LNLAAQANGASLHRWSFKRRLGVSAALIVLAVTSMTIGSLAAWNVIDSNAGNTFSTNTVLIDDNQGGEAGSATSSGTAIFDVTNLEPGSSSTTQCIGVDFSGSATVSSLTLGATLGGSGATTLESQLTMNTAELNTSGTVTVTPGTNTNSGSCANYPGGGSNTTIGTQGATLSSWSTGGPYTIGSPVTNTWYKFTVSGLPAGDSSCATYCNQTITITLNWTLTTN
jgi:hypothetical protein